VTSIELGHHTDVDRSDAVLSLLTLLAVIAFAVGA
jgi:hypothetical protein